MGRFCVNVILFGGRTDRLICPCVKRIQSSMFQSNPHTAKLLLDWAWRDSLELKTGCAPTLVDTAWIAVTSTLTYHLAYAHYFKFPSLGVSGDAHLREDEAEMHKHGMDKLKKHTLTTPVILQLVEEPSEKILCNRELLNFGEINNVHLTYIESMYLFHFAGGGCNMQLSNFLIPPNGWVIKLWWKAESLFKMYFDSPFHYLLIISCLIFL